MAVWLRENGKFYLPPSKPVARVLSTDEYVTETNIYFHAATDRLLTVGHPNFEILKPVTNEVVVPKVSAQQFRVFRIKLPDPNKFALIDPDIYNPERERLVWRLKGLEVSRGGPLGISVSGHPYFNKYSDVENPNAYPPAQEDDNRLNVGFDPKQNQVFIVGCTPPWGEYWDIAKPCADRVLQPGECPPIERKSVYIEDGDMSDMGLGAVNNKTFYEDKAGVPLELTNSISKWPDFLKMAKETYGDSMFFCGRREQLYVRHAFTKAGTMGDTIPEETERYFYNPTRGTPRAENIASSVYFAAPSGSLNSSDAQMFNKPFWLQRAQGQNNGVLWGNQMFVTVLDNTRATNFILSVYKESPPLNQDYNYKARDFNQYQRHAEVFEMELVVQLCKVTLDPDVLAHINVMNPTILDEWDLAFVPPPPQGIEDTYRYITSWATRCPTAETNKEKVDPYAKYKFWEIDLTEKFTSELSQTSLGRRFLYQSGILSRKRVRTNITANSGTKRSAKRKRTSK
ncbi:L1 protein [Human papillomavirus type 222]|uniref:Major capsid protein L1 n=2 Tax=Human papillomavirus types TaxID=173087 RepID=A0A2S1ZRY3_9PAPI|nr:L1 protein [Human papillomavirus type 222]